MKRLDANGSADRTNWREDTTPENRAKTILVIDDDPEMLERLQGHLERAGHRVVTASDGVEGVKMARETQPDLVITDLLLPGCSGFEVTRDLQHDKEFTGVPIIWVTAYYSHEDILERLGATGFAQIDQNTLQVLHKPFDMSDLVGRVNSLLACQERPRDPLNILVVDDDTQNLELIEGRLNAEGFTCRLTETGREALEAVETDTFDAVLLDLRLPDCDGLGLLKTLKQRLPDIPVVMMTAHGSEELAVQTLTQGAAHYLVKPVARRELKFAVANAVETARLQADNRKVHVNLIETVQALQGSIALIERERTRLATLVATMGEGVMLTNAVGLIEFMNPAALSLFRCSRQPASLRDLLAGVHRVEDDRGREIPTGPDFLPDPQPDWADRMCVYWWADGEFRAIGTTRTSYADEAGQKAGFVYVMKDDTARWTRQRRLEDLLDRQSKALQTSEKRRLEDVGAAESGAQNLRTAILSTISHELRTPINFITGFGSLLADGVLGELTPEQVQTVSKMLAGADRLRDVVENMLDGAMLASGNLRLRREPFDLAQVVAQTVESLLKEATDKGVRVGILTEGLPEARPEAQAEAQSGAHPGVFPIGDEDAARKITRHLVSNAIKFTGAGGEVLVRVHGGQGEPNVLEVQDTGIGIEADRMTEIFVPFYQADLSSTRRYPGTGMGLALVKGMAECMGAEVTVTSEPGRGSTFRVVWPPAG